MGLTYSLNMNKLLKKKYITAIEIHLMDRHWSWEQLITHSVSLIFIQHCGIDNNYRRYEYCYSIFYNEGNKNISPTLNLNNKIMAVINLFVGLVKYFGLPFGSTVHIFILVKINFKSYSLYCVNNAKFIHLSVIPCHFDLWRICRDT